MSHKNRSIPLLKLLVPALLLAAQSCARLGEAPVVFSEQNMLPAQPVVTGAIKPGMGADGGPDNWSFWAKSRTAASDAMLGRFNPFYKVNGVKLAVSAHFVLYRDILATVPPATMNATDAATVLATLESAYTNLKAVYGSGEHPYTNDGARIVILAYNIQDDYATTGSYVGGFFSPRDLYSNDFTQALFTDPVALQQYSAFIGSLGGYSNEMSIINYDLDPGYKDNPAQVNDIVIHELSHLFTYSKRVIKQRLVNHDLWIAEGIAENAPSQTQPAASPASVQQLRLQQLASPSMIENFQSAPQLTDFLTWASKIVAYLQSNLFFNYLRHRAEMNSPASSGAMLTQLMTLPDQTIDGLDSIIPSYIPGENFSSIYGDYVITHYLMQLGIKIDPVLGWNGAAASQLKYSMDNVQIGNSSPATIVNGTTVKSKYPATIPFNYEAPRCPDNTVGLKPNSYIVFRHQYDGYDKGTTNADGAGAIAGELPLKYVINLRTENIIISGSPPTSVLLRSYDAGQPLPLTSYLNAGDVIHMIIYNPNKTGSCRPFNSNLISKRNHSKWIGYTVPEGPEPTPDFYWRSKTGAGWRIDYDGGYYRPAGIAAFVGGYPNNFLYVSDFFNQSLQKVRMDDGTPMGRVGSDELTCPSSGFGWDSSEYLRYQNNYCANHFNFPQGVHADENHNIYVADAQNRRVVKYNSAGIFQRWLGLDGTGYQLAANVTDANSLLIKATTAPSRAGTTTAGSTFVTVGTTADLTLGMSVSGSGIVAGSNVATVVDATTFELSYAATASGSTTLTFSSGCSGYDPRMFNTPWAVTSDTNYLYVVDYEANRIIKLDRNSGVFLGYIGNNHDGWYSTIPALPCAALFSSGWQAGYFDKPKGIAIAGGYLYISEQKNHRIVKVNASTGIADGWLGDGASGWRPMTDIPSGIGSSANKFFNQPAAVATDGTYLFVADQLNNRVVKWRIDGSNCDKPARSEPYCGWIGHGKVGWEYLQSAPATDPYAGVSAYPADYYAQPLGLALVNAAQKGTKNNYLYITSLYNGRVTRVNLSCVDAPFDPVQCTPIFDPFAP